MSLFDDHMGVTSLMWFSNKETCMMTQSNFQEFVIIILQNSFWIFFIFYSNIRNLLFCYCNNFKLLFYFSCFYLTLSVLWINGLSPFIKLLFSLNQYMYIKSWIEQTIWTPPLPLFIKRKPDIRYYEYNLSDTLCNKAWFGPWLCDPKINIFSFFRGTNVPSYMFVQYEDVDWSTLGLPTNMSLKTSDMYLSTNKVLY